MPTVKTIALSPPAGIGAFALGTVRYEFTFMLRHEPRVRMGQDPEGVHQMRVACRRVRAALRLFEACLPRAVTDCDDALQRVGKVLGAVRDLDVKSEQLRRWREEAGQEHRKDFDLLMAWVARHRDQALQGLMRVLNSPRYARFVERMEQALQRLPSSKPECEYPAGDAMPGLIQPLYQRLLREGRNIEAAPSPEDYHRLRIRCKRLRYALEFASRLPTKSLKNHRKRLVDLQDLLGEYNDTAVARANIRSWVGSRMKLPPTTHFLLGMLEERLRVQGEACLDEFPELFRQLRKRPWRSLAKALRSD